MKAEDLKNSILQLAMQGKLVPQDPNDEPASILLEKIHEEKEKLIKDKKIKRNNKESFIFRKNGHFYERIGKRGEPICIDDEIPFDIPDSWEWVRINTIREVYTGNSINKTEKETKFTGLTEGYNYIATKDVKFDNSIDYDNGVKIPKDLEKFRVASLGSILLCIEGGSAGRKIGILDQDVCFGNKLACFKTFNETNDFLFYYLQSPNFKEIFKSKKTGIIGGVGIAKLRNVLMPIPPFNEQKRIIVKLQDLFPKINEYGIYEKKLDKLNSEFPDKLRSSILQEAIQGKLVLQNPDDEPASVLLEKIRDEKERLIKEKKIKRNKNESYIFKENNHFYEKIGDNEPVCVDDEIPFDIPETWEWSRLNTICTKLTDGSHNPPPKKDSGIPVLSVKNINQNEIDFNSIYRFTDENGFNKENPRTNISKGDIILGIVGSIGEVAIYKSDKKVIAQRSIAIIKTEIFNYYLTYIFESMLFKKYAKTYSKGTAQRGLYLNSLKEFLVPIPPLNEQKRIMAVIGNILDYL